MKETPSQLFERLVAPVFVPPSRPDLKAKYQGSVAKTTRPTPAARRPAASRAAPPPKRQGGPKKKEASSQEKAAQLRAAFEARRAAEAAAKQATLQSSRSAPPKSVRSAPTTARRGETPAQAFERLAAPIFVPPSRPDLKAKYQGVVTTVRGKAPSKPSEPSKLSPQQASITKYLAAKTTSERFPDLDPVEAKAVEAALAAVARGVPIEEQQFARPELRARAIRSLFDARNYGA
jgi:hypothetical protein